MCGVPALVIAVLYILLYSRVTFSSWLSTLAAEKTTQCIPPSFVLGPPRQIGRGTKNGRLPSRSHTRGIEYGLALGVFGARRLCFLCPCCVSVYARTNPTQINCFPGPWEKEILDRGTDAMVDGDAQDCKSVVYCSFYGATRSLVQNRVT